MKKRKEVNEMIIEQKLTDITNGIINRNAPRSVKMQVLETVLNPSKYTFIGFSNNGSMVRLEAKYHNIRDKKGRFKCIKKK
jgi:hypothetical protein